LRGHAMEDPSVIQVPSGRNVLGRISNLLLLTSEA
jgi:hypothetical protein